MERVEKPWGHELIICNSEKYCGKRIFVEAGKNLSLHYHAIKDEVLFVERGSIEFITLKGKHLGYSFDIKRVKMKEGESVHVKTGQVHQITAFEDTVLFEFSTQHFDDDSIRLTRERF